MTRRVSDAIRIMRLAISRRNTNDPDSSDDTLLGYLNDFVSLTMGSDVKLFELYGTLNFEIDETVEDGVYTFNDVGSTDDFVAISGNGFISLTTPPTGSLSWTPLNIYLNPEDFYSRWGVQNEDVLTPGMPTDMLFYGNQLVFRTIPDTGYTVNLYGYRKLADMDDEGNPALEFDHWLRFIAYGAALAYAKDYGYDANLISMLQRNYAYERRQMLQRTHDQIKVGRGHPSF